MNLMQNIRIEVVESPHASESEERAAIDVLANVIVQQLLDTHSDAVAQSINPPATRKSNHRPIPHVSTK